MIIKPYQGSDESIVALEALLPRANPEQRKAIENEIRFIRAGDKAEKEAAYYIDFHFGHSNNKSVVLHGLRLEHEGRVAQIDHLIISRFLEVYVYESKSFGAGLKITPEGEFLRWNPYFKTYEGMSNPMDQNDRHVRVLKSVFDRLSSVPRRLGLKLKPTFHSVVLVSTNARILRPSRKSYDTRNVIPADQVVKHWNKTLDEEDPISTVTSVGKFLSYESIEAIGQELAALHTPIVFDYAAKFGIQVEPSPRDADTPTKAPAPAAQCFQCDAPVERKVVTFCLRFNKKRFGGKVYCQACQPSIQP